MWGRGGRGGWENSGGGGVNGHYRLTACPHHRQFQPLVHKFSHPAHFVSFLVGVLHNRKCRDWVGWYAQWHRVARA